MRSHAGFAPCVSFVGLVSLVVSLAAGVAVAQSIEVRAYVEPASGVTEGQTVRYVIEMTGSGDATMSRPRLAGLENLRVVAGPSSSMSSVWTGGRFSMTSKLIYTLVPKGVGPAAIPALEIEAGGRRFTTQAIRFDVGPAPTGPAARTVPTPRGGSAAPPSAAERADVFVASELGAKEVWVGETVPLTLYLYATEQVVGTELVSEPTLSSFWVEDVEVDPNSESFERQVGDRRYRVFPLKRQLIVPQAPGAFELEPTVVRLAVRARRRGDPFDLFGMGRRASVVRKTSPLSLTVRSLPDEGRPASFGGAVGTFDVRAEIDRDRARVNDAVALRVTVEGLGSLRSIAPPQLDPPPDVKLFDPETDSNYRVARGGMRSTKRWEWIMVPLGTGELPLPPVEFSWFDPDEGVYRTATSTPGPLTVERESGTPRGPDARVGLELQRRDLAYVKLRRGPLRFDDPRVHRRNWFVPLAIAPLLWVPLAIVLGRRRRRLLRDRGQLRARGSARRAKAALREAARGADTERDAAVARAVTGYVADRFDRSPAGLTHDDLDRLLASRGVDDALRGELRRLLERCDAARYVPGGHGEARPALDEASGLIDRLERAL